MKRLLLACAIVAVVLPAAPRAQASDVSVDFFYNNLSGGSWIEVGDYGYCWQPDVALSADWRPYSDGYWAYTDLGWTWVSYEDFGWATYHYGRWVRLSGRGWVWVPGRDEDLEWGPAWVSWRTGGDYIGWAPLPPRRRGVAISFGARIGGRVDIDFDIGPDYYNFVDVRYIGEPVLRDRIYQRSQNVTYINQTVNVTNITYQDNRVYNYGPDYNALSTRSSRPIQRLKLEQQTNVDASAAAKSGTLTKVEGDRLVVAAPTTIKKSAKPIAPPTVKEKVAQANVDHGWAGVSDPKQQEELKKKMQTEDNKKIPPPTTGASVAAQAGAGASPSASVSAGISGGASVAPGTSPAASAAASASPGAKGKGKTRLGEQLQPAGAASPGTSASPGASASPAGRGKAKNRFEQVQPGASVAPGASASPALTPELGRPGKGKRGELQTVPTPAGGLSPATETTTAPGGKGKGKFERGTPAATASPADTSSKTNLNSSRSNIYKSAPSTPAQSGESSAELPRGKGKTRQLEPMGTPAGGGNESPEGGASTGGKGKMKDANVQSPIAPTGAGPVAPEGGKGKGKKAQESPSPTP
jgi:uncharacterized protein DUF6600